MVSAALKENPRAISSFLSLSPHFDQLQRRRHADQRLGHQPRRAGSGLVFDLGHRKINAFRLVRPVVVTGVIIAFYVKSVATNGNGLAFEDGLAACRASFSVLWPPPFFKYAAKPSTASLGARRARWYALLWVVVVGARLAFEDEAFTSHALDRWFATNSLSSNVITNVLIFMAITMVLTRTAGLRIRASLSAHGPTAPSVVANA